MKVSAVRLNNLNTNLNNDKLTNKNVPESTNKGILPVSDNYGRYIVFGSSSTEPKSEIKGAIQSLLKKENLDAVILAATDDYLTEFVPDEYNQLAHVSGFTGENGQALIIADETKAKSQVFVDGRYYIQVDKQVDPNLFKIEKAGLNEKGELINEYVIERMIKSLTKLSQVNAEKELMVGFDPAQISINDFDYLKRGLVAMKANVNLIPLLKNPVGEIWKDKPAEKVMPIRLLPLSVTGEATHSKLAKVRNFMKENKIDIFAVTNLSDIAYLTNMRGQDIDYNAVFKSKLLLTQDKAVLFCNPSKIPAGTVIDTVEVASDKSFNEVVEHLSGKFKNAQIALSSDSNYSSYLGLTKLGNIVDIDENPVAQMKMIKNETEMKVYKQAIKQTDFAITDLIRWINKVVNIGGKVSEKELSDMMTQMHKEYGAIGLSFSTIPAVAENSALPHYENGSSDKFIKKGDLVLVDTGAYYKSGLATDITRTWIAGGKKSTATQKQKEIYTTTLKGALKGIFAELEPGATGFDIDSLVRNTITQVDPSYDFAHATGHGVGIEVHECPPFVNRREISKKPLKPGMIFSIEPGVYVEGFGGVRFENLVTVVKHSDPTKAKKGWHQIKCLSFAPVDHNLIDKSLLNEQELKWLKMFSRKSEELMAELKRIKK